MSCIPSAGNAEWAQVLNSMENVVTLAHGDKIVSMGRDTAVGVADNLFMRALYQNGSIAWTQTIRANVSHSSLSAHGNHLYATADYTGGISMNGAFHETILPCATRSQLHHMASHYVAHEFAAS